MLARSLFCVLILISVPPSLSGCFNSTDAPSINTCRDAVRVPDGRRCEPFGECEITGGCCRVRVSCDDGVLVSESDCSACERTWETCGAFLGEGGRTGDLCGSGFGECERTSDCCTETLECFGGAVTETAIMCAEECDASSCEGYPPVIGAGCDDRVICPPSERCFPNEPLDWYCDECVLDDCMTLDDCPGDEWCVQRDFLCSCTGATVGKCVAACTTDIDCEFGEDCSPLGECVALACITGDHVCPPTHECIPGSPNSDSHGCQRIPCRTNADCPCGACIEELCWGGPGSCRALPD